jgi:NADP-reducing hydrogenase subunit HndD
MVNLKINNLPILVDDGTTILDAAKIAGIKIPTLCYLKELNEIAACRVCVVEVEGVHRLVTSCNNVVSEGMEVHTNTAKVREARKTNVELILSQHHTNCPSCVRSGNCQLQTVANSLDLVTDRYKNEPFFKEWPSEFPLIRDSSKCIKCMRCIQICDVIQGMNIWDVANTGSRTTVDVSGNRKITETNCTLCGQCITHCPTGALQERDDVSKIFAMHGILNNKELITVVQVAPAVRAAWGEEFGLSQEFANEKRLVAALKNMGFDYVFDTNFSADLTIMEEGMEFIHKMEEGNEQGYPLFTSCCPAWVSFMKSRYPDMVPYLSTAKSPQQMFGAITKTYFAEKIGVAPEKIRCISVMPCVAKKAESDLPFINAVEKGKDVDVVLTTREICRMIQFDQIDVTKLPEMEFDSPLGTGSGAAVIFGVTGGVMEAALRTCYAVLMGKNPDMDTFQIVRGPDGWKEAEFTLGDKTLKLAVASGLSNAASLMEAIQMGKVSYDFVEVMACPGGCAGGGGQPIHDNLEMAVERSERLYLYDEKNPLRFSHENKEVQLLYEEFLKEPNSHLAHELLHTNHRII